MASADKIIDEESASTSDGTRANAPTLNEVGASESGSREGWVRYVFGSAWRFLLVAFTVIGGVVAAIQLIIWLNSTPEITINVLDVQCLTTRNETPDLVSYYEYKGNSVDNLWSVKVRLENNSVRSIIGHNQTDLISTGIVLNVEAPYEIVSHEVETNQFGAEITVLSNQVLVVFTKWKPNQTCTLRLLCTADERDGVKAFVPRVSADMEQLTQGEMRIVELQQGDRRIYSVGMLAFASEPVAKGIVWVGRIGFVVMWLLTAVFLIFFTPWFSGLRRLIWERMYGQIVEAYGAKQGAAESWDYHTNLEKVPDSFWEELHVPRPPKPLGPFRSWVYTRRNLAVAWVCGVIVCILSYVALASLMR